MVIFTKASKTADLCKILDTFFGEEWEQACFNVYFHETTGIKAFVLPNQPFETTVCLVVNGKVIEKDLSEIIKFTTRIRKKATQNWAWLRIDIKETKGADSR